MLNNILRFNHKGFTILEVMVAIFVITIGVISAFNVAQNITLFSRANSSRLTATYLAQEGIELVRNQRDNNWIQGAASWDNSIVPSGPPGCTGSFTLGRTFNRTCEIVSAASEMDVSVTVEWQEIGVTHSVTNATKLYNWLP